MNMQRIVTRIADAARGELPSDVAVTVEDGAVVITGSRLAARAWGRFTDPRFRGLLAAIRGSRR